MEGKPTLRMEAICDPNIRVFHIILGISGMLDDLNILVFSTHFSDVLYGKFPPSSVSCKINFATFYWLYYLGDGIYPPVLKIIF